MRRIHTGRNNLAEWYTKNNLLLNISKTKELIIDFRKKEEKTYTPIYMSPGVPPTMLMKAQKWLYFLWKLKKAKFPCQVLVNFYRGTPATAYSLCCRLASKQKYPLSYHQTPEQLLSSGSIHPPHSTIILGGGSTHFEMWRASLV